MSGKQYIERDCLFAIFNDFDKTNSDNQKQRLIWAGLKGFLGKQELIEIDRNLFGLLQVVQSLMNSLKYASIKITIHSLKGMIKPSKSKPKLGVMSLDVQMKKF